MAIKKFQEWYENRHDYQKDRKKGTGGKMVGYLCAYGREEIHYAFDALAAMVLDSHQIQDVTEPPISAMFCPFCRDALAHGLKGRYDYPDGIILHFNHGYDGLSVVIAENRRGLLKRGNKVMTYEGNMGDEGEFDEKATQNRIDIFLESMGLDRPQDLK